ncbi:cytokine receptor common subunit gamma-like isoform X2 [Dunckerocampus dactyliophorus]|uniref:cytokine receptor common subunit gamma-like isoform X2 n=1 Tax=Dunckerocampus dactyliophorus TaxID=161453 RepID=UPI002404BB72|nr:cytokine receptor common subunit gamma-like isoform X2 [Dunckerocampus dactyliophorus]
MFFCSAMLNKFLLLLCLAGPIVAQEPPDVDCIVLHLETVRCSWNATVNYTFSSWFYGENVRVCEHHLTQRENNINNGCIQPYENRFLTFYTQLGHGNSTSVKEHNLINKVKLNPPTNLTVQNGSDSNLWFYWNQTSPHCVENEVRYRINYKKWNTYLVIPGKQSYCINLPSSRSQYELQVRSKMEKTCGKSDFWSDWSESVVWGSNKEADQAQSSMFVWIIVYVLPPVTLALMVILLLKYEWFRIRFIHVVPKPFLILQDIETWLQISKGFKEGLKTNYHEHACPVREYCQDSEFDSQSSDGSTSSFNTEQTDYSLSLPGDTSHSCSSTTVPTASTEEFLISD